MERKRFFNTKMIATTGILLAIELVMQLLANYIVIPGGFANLNFSVIIIALGAILYGPIVGGFLGLISGILTLFSPSTMQFFFSISPLGAVLTCLLKTTIAGIVAGLVSNFLKKKHDTLNSVIASILVPTLNTGIFAIFAIIFFKPLLAGTNYNNMAAALFLGLIGVNFIVEIIITIVVVPSLYKIVLQNNKRERD